MLGYMHGGGPTSVHDSLLMRLWRQWDLLIHNMPKLSILSWSSVLSLFGYSTVVPEFQFLSTGLNVTSNNRESNVSLSCSFRGIPEPNITWTSEDGRDVTGADSQLVQQLPHVYSSTLMWDSIQKSDEGYYFCNGTNANGSSTEILYMRVQGQS